MNKQDMQFLYEYNRWADARILGSAAKINQAQFLAPTGFPHGSLRGTLVHTLFGEWLWRMRWQGSPSNPRWQEDDFPTFESLRARWEEEQALLMEFVDGLTDDRLQAGFDYVSTEGDPHRRILWEAMAHLVFHGMQHRTEAAAMLTQLGHSPGNIDLIVFLNKGPGQK
jgi:uncharacterized damage-inducible protein DinB